MMPTTAPGPVDRAALPPADRTTDVLLGAAVVAMGLLAGLFYAFDVAVMPGLGAADDRTFVDAMHQMIELPAFPLTLLGALAATIAALVRARRTRSGATRWIAAALGCYLVMVAVSVAVHFPLNDALLQAGDPARIDDPAAVRDDFAATWVAWNLVRTLALTAALGCLVRALLVHARTARHLIAPRSTAVGS